MTRWAYLCDFMKKPEFVPFDTQLAFRKLSTNDYESRYMQQYPLLKKTD